MSVLRSYGLGTGLRGWRRGTTGVCHVWRVSLTLADGATVTVDIETHFASMAISLAKARLRRGDTVVAEKAVQL